MFRLKCGGGGRASLNLKFKHKVLGLTPCFTVERVVRGNRGAVHASSAELMDDMILDDLSRGQRTLILIEAWLATGIF